MPANPAATRRHFLKTAGLAAAGASLLPRLSAAAPAASASSAASLAAAASPSAAPTPLVSSGSPNLLFLVTDQQSWDALGVTNPALKTPHLDRLAARGILFDQAICQCPMCIPSRYSFCTGLYPSQIGVLNNAQAIQDSRQMPIPTLFERLRDAGYYTIGAGKTHWTIAPRPERGVPDVVPSTFGFTERYIARMPGGHDREPGAVFFGDADQQPERMAAIRAWNREAGHGGEGVKGYLGRTLPGDGSDLREAWLTDRTIAAIERAHAAKRPWHAYLSFDAPHAPLYAPETFEALYDLDDIPDPGLPPDRYALTDHFTNLAHTEDAVQAWLALSPRERRVTLRRYYALCSYADAQFGRVLDYLERSGQTENTVIVFTSDHGDSMGDRYRFSKYSLYEASLRVPLIVAGLAVPAAARGTRDSRPAELIDLVPTFLAAAGLPVPLELPGENLLAPSTRAGAFSEMHGNGSDELQRAPAYAWRTQDWKLVLYFDGDFPTARRAPAAFKGELYDLAADPREWVNRYDDPAARDIRERLTRELLMHLALANAAWPRRDSVGALA